MSDELTVYERFKGLCANMKRDMDLVRDILMEVERQETVDVQGGIHVARCSPDTITYHIYIMEQGGLLSGIALKNQANIIPHFSGVCLTWQGHEFLDAARNETRWKKAMTMVQRQGGSVTVGVLIQLLSSLMKSSFGLD
jgi:hypothetical protein